MKTIGIVGGMGPLATMDLFRKIIDGTDAKSDSEHIRVVVDSNTNIPDRTKAILDGGTNPVPELVRSAVGLEGMGADFLVMPCNTAHFFYNEVCSFVKIPILHMISETLEEMRRMGIKKAALLATDGTCRSGVYHNVFEGSGVELILPEADDQAEVMKIIYSGVKAGVKNYDTKIFLEAIDRLTRRGAETMILGCTELPLAFEMYGIDRKAVDPTDILATAAVREAKN